MDIVFQLLLIIHLVAFGVGITTTIAMPLVMSLVPKVAPVSRPLFGALGLRFSTNARIALAVLIASGIAMVMVRYGGVDGMNAWFWAKMALVVVVLAAIVAGALAKPGTLNPKVMGWITRLSMLGIVITAVLAFT